MSFDHWNEILFRIRKEDSSSFEAVIQTLRRIQWRLIKGEQRHRVRTVPIDQAVASDRRPGFHEADWRVIMSQLPSTEADAAPLAILQGYTESEAGSSLGFCQSYVHKVKEKAIFDLEPVLHEQTG